MALDPRLKKHDSTNRHNFTGKELRALERALVDGTAPRLITEAEHGAFIAWAWRTRVAATMLDMILEDGSLVATWQIDDWCFNLRGDTKVSA